MAGNRPSTGLNVHTVQEATNKLAQRKVIRVSPTLAAAATGDTAGDVLVNLAEIPNAVLTPGGCSALWNCNVMDYTDLQGTSYDMLILFHQHNAANFGSLDASASISDANLKLNKILGGMTLDRSAGDTEDLIDSAILNECENLNSTTTGPRPVYLQAEEGSNSVYFSVIQLSVASATPDWDTGDLEFIFHIDY